MSATQRLWSPSSFDHANQQQIAPTNENGSRLMSVRRPGASSPAVAAPHVPATTHARPQQQATSYQQQQQQQQSYFSPPSSYTTLSTQPNSYFPSVVPSISTQSTPILIAKELPLAPPTPSTNPILLPNSMYYIHPGSASPSPSPARQLPVDAHRPLLYRQQTPTQYPSSHSRSNSFSSSTNNVVTSNSSAGYPPVLTIPVSSSTLSSPISSSQMSSPHPTTPKSRRTSLITTSLATAIHNNLALVAAANGGMSSNGTASVGMSPQSSYGLPSPTFPPRTLPFSGANNGSVVTPATPSRPPRSPARPPAGFGAQGALGLSPLTPLPFPASSSSPTPAPGTVTAISNHNQAIHPPHPLSASTAPSHNYSAPIPRAPRQSLTQSQSQAHALSRRNSRQVSVRLSAAFVPPSLTPRSRSGSVSVSGSRVGSVAGHARRMSRVGSMVDNGESEGLDILKAGDIIGRGCLLRGQIVRAVQPVAPQEPVNKSASSSAHVCANARYEVVRSLGTGSYAVVYLVREILPPPTPVKTPSALGLSSLSDDIFDEDDFFGLSQPPIQVFPPSRTLSNKSNIVRRPSVLKPIDELLPSSAPSSGPSSSSGSTSSSSAPGTPPSAQAQSQPQYGREFAIKVLSKRNLAADELAVQRTEVSIHQSLRAHGNIVTLYGALETEELLMLVLEYVRGEDLYYFLETEQIGEGEAQDNSSRRSSMYSSYSALSEDGEMTLDELLDEPARGRRRTRRPRQDSQHQPSTGTTPPTPSLLSNVHPNAMLSYDRLRLIASMFAQMCDAVQACHAQGISHRDIKPENFIVTTTSDDTDKANSMGKVIVKLSDFGLATTDRWSADVDCGSAPYMSYECRNVVGPTYATQPADVWSLGIVLINMLYHHNLWQDTFEGDASFEAFRQQPIPFLMQRSPGMTRDVAEFLAERVFSIMPEAPADEEDPALLAEYEHQTEHVRVTAAEFGEWARQLPAMFFNAGISANPLVGAADVQEQLPAPVVGTVSAVSAVSRRLSAGFPHSPNCVHSQLHYEHQHPQALLAHVSTGADEDEDEAAAMLDVTLTQSDFGDDYLGLSSARVDDLHTPNLLAQFQSSPSMSTSAPRSPRSPPVMARTMTPLPAEPMPLAQPVVDVKLSDLGGGRVSPLGLSTNGDCLACTYDEHIGLGLTGAPVLSVAEIIDGDSEEGKRMRSRKRGQRRKKDPSAPPSNVSSPLVTSHTVLPNVNGVVAAGKQFDLDGLAQGMQDFAREVSRTRPVSVTRPRSTSRSRSRAPVLPPLPNSTNVPSPLNPHPLYHSADMVSPLDNPAIDPSTPSLPPSVASAVVSHKKSKLGWLASRHDADEPEDQSERASSLLKGLNSTLRPTAPNSKSNSQTTSSGSGKSFQTNSQGSVGSTSIAFTPPPLPQGMATGPDAASWRGRPQQQQQQQRGRDPPSTAFRNALNDRRERSPASSTYSGRSIATTVPSWRNSANTSSSAASSMYNGSVPSSSASSTFTRFRNGSEASFATTATTVSAASTFNTGGIGGAIGSEKKAQGPVARPPSVKNHAEPGPPKPQQRRHPVNVKQMHGIPWELDELPRQMQPTVNGKMPMGDVHGAPPRRGKRNGGPTPKPPALDTISERPKGVRRPTSPGGGESGESDSGGPLSPPVAPEPLTMAPPKKVQKGQINSLAKLLTSFNRSKKD